MNSTWQTFLDDAGAVRDQDRIIHYGSPQRELQVARSGEIIADLSHLGDLTVAGDDALGFLQGQLTSDIAALDEHTWQWSGYCNPQGRLLALFRVFRHEDRFHLLLPASLQAATLQRLQLFVLRSRVALHDSSDDWIRFGYAGRHADSRLAELTTARPTSPGEMARDGDLTVLRLHGEQPRYLLTGTMDALMPLWERLDVHAAPVGADAWQALEIDAAIPDIHPGTMSMFIPQMLNLRELDAISFTKGCYTGQEIVARLQYRGTLKRRMYRAHMQDSPCPEAGAAIHVRGQDQPCGNVVVAAPSPDGGFGALVVIAVEQAAAGLCYGDPAGPEVIISDPPYPFAPLSKKPAG